MSMSEDILPEACYSAIRQVQGDIFCCAVCDSTVFVSPVGALDICCMDISTNVLAFSVMK